MEDWKTLCGTRHIEERTVTPDMLASHLASGTVDVFATPCMVALMEYACMQLLAPHLPEGITTVGTLVNITHTNPTPAGMRVRAEAALVETDGRRFVFRVEAYDEAGQIGEGIHERHTVKAAKFQEKAAQRGQ